MHTETGINVEAVLGGSLVYDNFVKPNCTWKLCKLMQSSVFYITYDVLNFPKIIVIRTLLAIRWASYIFDLIVIYHQVRWYFFYCCTICDCSHQILNARESKNIFLLNWLGWHTINTRIYLLGIKIQTFILNMYIHKVKILNPLKRYS